MKKLVYGAAAFALIAALGSASACDRAAKTTSASSPAAHTTLAVQRIPAAAPALTGDYVESRSLSVFAGACHYGGEAVTAGQEAILAWRVKDGSWDGQKLNGLAAVAVVNGSDNLAMDPNGHRTLLYVDGAASAAQRDALVKLLSARYRAVLGDIRTVSAAPVQFETNGKSYRVRVPGAVYVAADKFPCDKCVMPNQVWYSPFVPLKGAQVARALRTEFKASAPQFATWSHDEANSAYIGEFTL